VIITLYFQRWAGPIFFLFSGAEYNLLFQLKNIFKETKIYCFLLLFLLAVLKHDY
jgi:hypothetical protein